MLGWLWPVFRFELGLNSWMSGRVTVHQLSYVSLNMSFSIPLTAVHRVSRFFIINSSPPVSYTHLDVYKRQVYTLHFLSDGVSDLIRVIMSLMYGPTYNNSNFLVLPSMELGNSLFFISTLSPTLYLIVFFWLLEYLFSCCSTFINFMARTCSEMVMPWN